MNMLFHSTARGGLVFAVRRVFVARNCVGQPSESVPKNANTNPPLASSPLFFIRSNRPGFQIFSKMYKLTGKEVKAYNSSNKGV